MVNERQFFVYIMASGKKGTVYIGVTSDLPGRIYTHRNDLIDGFARRYGVRHLVYFAHHESADSAIIREKHIKKWRRAWKEELIEKSNPHWLDLYSSIAAG